jgi:hypothetical protein
MWYVQERKRKAQQSDLWTESDNARLMSVASAATYGVLFCSVKR